MNSPRVLIVEDEPVIAMDIESRLQSLGYAVPAIVSSGEEAVLKAGQMHPDLVLMDIKLKGEMDGVQTAGQIRDRFGIPVVYLTAFADEHTLQRAKVTEPFGYLLKPFNETELRVTVEMALYKHGMEKKLRDSEEKYRQHLENLVAARTAELEAANDTLRSEIAERKRAEAALRKAHDELERKVEERTAQLTETNVLLREEITERRQAEEALQRRNRELELLNRVSRAFGSSLDLDQVLVTILEGVRSLLDVLGASIWLIDPETGGLVCRQVADSQSAAVRGWRLAPGEGIAGWVAHSGQSLIVPDTRADERYLKEVARRAGMVLRSILSVPLRAKEEVIGVLQVVDNQVGRFTAQDLELLEPLAASAAIAIENARLYESLQDQIKSLQKAQAQLVQGEKMAALGRLAASLAHEINNPLQSVQNCLTLTREELDGSRRPEKLDRYLGIVENEIERIGNVVRRMYDFYRPARQEFRLTDLHAALESVLELTGKQLQHSGVTVERVWAGDLPDVLANADHLKQVFLNLVLNAIDAMPGGGRLRIRTAPDRSPAGDAMARLEFSDSGEGMSPEVLAHLFEPFFTTKEGGSGLGLSISYAIVEAHHGQISVQSRVGVGTTFTILLPASP